MCMHVSHLSILGATTVHRAAFLILALILPS